MKSKSAHRPERIGDILQERIRSLGWEQRLREEDIYACWGDVVGPQIAAHSRPSHVANRRLTVVTESPAWTQQLLFLKTELLRRILRRLGPDIITELYFVTGRIEAAAPPRAAEPAEEEAPAAPMPADLEREIAAIADGEVRESLRRVCLAGLRRRGPERGRPPTGAAAGPRS